MRSGHCRTNDDRYVGEDQFASDTAGCKLRTAHDPGQAYESEPTKRLLDFPVQRTVRSSDERHELRGSALRTELHPHRGQPMAFRRGKFTDVPRWRRFLICGWEDGVESSARARLSQYSKTLHRTSRSCLRC